MEKWIGNRGPIFFVALFIAGFPFHPGRIAFSRSEDPESATRRLFQDNDWTIVERIGDLRLKLPPNFLHEAGEFPVALYWAVANALSKDIGLDFSAYLNCEVRVKIYELKGPLPKFLRPQTQVHGIVLEANGRIVGAYIRAFRVVQLTCSLRNKRLPEVTGKSWDEWVDGHIDYENPLESKLSAMSAEEIIKTHYEAIERRDRKTKMACLTRRRLCEYLSFRMPDFRPYNTDFIETDTLSARLSEVQEYREAEQLRIAHPGVRTFTATGVFKFVEGIPASSGMMTFYLGLRKETPRSGWRIDYIGTGP